MQIKEYFATVRHVKGYVLKLKKKELSEFKKEFYKLPFKNWQLDLIWEFFWDDIDYMTIYKIFKERSVI